MGGREEEKRRREARKGREGGREGKFRTPLLEAKSYVFDHTYMKYNNFVTFLFDYFVCSILIFFGNA
jgi:hypothetical protein